MLLSVASVTLMFRLSIVVSLAEDPIFLLVCPAGTGVATLLDVLGEPVHPIAPRVVL